MLDDQQKDMRAHPVVRFLYYAIERSNETPRSVSIKAGLGKNAVKSWSESHAPSIANLDAALDVFGFELNVRLKKKKTP